MVCYTLYEFITIKNEQKPKTNKQKTKQKGNPFLTVPKTYI